MKSILWLRSMSLVQQFSLLLFFTLFLMALFLGKIISSTLRQDMIVRSNEIIAGFINYEIEHHIQVDNFSRKSPPSEYTDLSRQVGILNLGPGIEKIKIWNRDRSVVWSTDVQDVGVQNLNHPDLEKVFSGRTVTEISSKDFIKEKYAYELEHDIMELYIPVRKDGRGDVVLIFEIYKNIDELLENIVLQAKRVWMATFGGAVLLYVILVGLVWRASRRLDWQNRQIGVSEQKFRSLIHSAQDGIVACTTSGRIILVNTAAEQIFGYTHAEMEALPFVRLFAGGKGETIITQLTDCAITGDCSRLTRSFEGEGVRKEGERFPLEVSLSVSGDGESMILTGIFRDTSQRILLMEQIATAKNEWEETFDTINDAITIHDNNFNIIRANRAAESMLGLPLPDLVKQKCYKSYHGADEPLSNCPSCQLARAGSDTIVQTYESHLDKYLEIKALPRYNKAGQLIGIVHVVRDITAQKKGEERQQRLQDQLNQSQKMETVGKLAGGIAHDFNNMLSAIIGYSEIILLSLSKDSHLYEDVLTIKEAGEKAAALTRQLLAFSRKQVLEVRPVDLNTVVEGMAKMIARVIGDNIRLDLRLGKGLGRVAADPGQIEQVLLNLAVNARDAMPGGGKLQISTEGVQLTEDFASQHADVKIGPYILLTVSDTGTGISEEIMERIFEPFFTTKEVGRGTGLGLATVYGIVKQHGGQILVHSEMNKGTTFQVYLPLTEASTNGEKRKGLESIPAGKETVLLVEDDATIRKMLKNILESEGYSLLVASDGHEAIQVSTAYAREIDLLLTDVIMPNLNGQELADTLRKSRPKMEVIFMTGYAEDFIARHGGLDPGVNLLQKPVTPSKLAQKMKEVLNKS